MAKSQMKAMRNFEDFTVIFCRNGKTMTRNLSTAIMSNVRIETRIPTTCRNGTILHSTVPNLPCTSHSLPRSQVTVARGMYTKVIVRSVAARLTMKKLNASFRIFLSHQTTKIVTEFPKVDMATIKQ